MITAQKVRSKSKAGQRAPQSTKVDGRSGKRSSKRWSKHVTETSHAMDLEAAVFRRGARAIAESLKRSAERSRRRKSTPYRSAMSMLTFYINRAGRNISATQRHKLEQAKTELRRLFGKQR